MIAISLVSFALNRIVECLVISSDAKLFSPEKRWNLQRSFTRNKYLNIKRSSVGKGHTVLKLSQLGRASGILLSVAPHNDNFSTTLPTGEQKGAHTLKQTATICHPALLQAITTFTPQIEMDACRIFHGRGGLFPGAEHLALDYYPPVFLLTSFEYLSKEELIHYRDALNQQWEMHIQNDAGDSASQFTFVYQCRVERGNSTAILMSGNIPDPHIVTECSGKNKFLVHLLKGQNHGLFLDMASGRTWIQDKCSQGEITSVLNLFAYTCAFSIAALNGGADTVVNVDMSHSALKIGQRNHELNGLVKAGGAKFLSHDIWKTWGKLKKMGPYDCVVVDPPSYQKGSFVASKDYIKVIRRLPSLLKPKAGWALLCLNAPELGTDFLIKMVAEGAPDLVFVERLKNPASFDSAIPERALKVMVFQYRPSFVAA